VQPDTRQLSGTTVLCIDNDLSILDGMRALLEGWGCQVLQASGLADAERVVAEAGMPLDCLLVDFRLDEGNGIEAILQLRRDLGPEMPAILITADRSLRLRREAREHGIDFLNKPLKPAALRALLAQYRIRRIAAAE
jgi:CheY-like chemotaxis protein